MHLEIIMRALSSLGFCIHSEEPIADVWKIIADVEGWTIWPPSWQAEAWRLGNPWQHQGLEHSAYCIFLSYDILTVMPEFRHFNCKHSLQKPNSCPALSLHQWQKTWCHMPPILRPNVSFDTAIGLFGKAVTARACSIAHIHPKKKTHGLFERIPRICQQSAINFS